MTKRIFSGDESREFWDAINELRETNREAWEILYWFGCKCQELEAKIDAHGKGVSE